jgi:hypothetical protein
MSVQPPPFGGPRPGTEARPAPFAAGGHPDGGHPDGGYPDGGYPDGGYPDGGRPDGRHPDGGRPDRGYPGGGHDGSGRTAPAPASAGRRAAAVAGLVAVALAGAAGGWFLAHRTDAASTATSPASPGPGVSPGPSVAASSAAPTPSSSAPATVALSDVAHVDARAGLTELKKAGLKATGSPVDAWSWTDTNGRNLFVTTKSVDKREGPVVRAATLHVYHAAGLGRQPRMLLTPLRDPGTPNCDVDFGLDFVPGSVQVSDTDGDGHGEATVAWWSICRGDPGAERLKLALVTKGTYYILRGYGLRAGETLPAGITVPPATFTPNVAAGRWPHGSYDAATALFRQFFR